MPSQIERVGAYLDLHIGEKLDTPTLAHDLGIPKGNVTNIIDIHYLHRLEPPTGKKRVILPSDGPDPMSYKNVSKIGPKKEEPVMIYTSGRRLSHRLHSDQAEDDWGSE